MKFKTEGELCDHFTLVAKASGWQVFPEVRGWDLVLFDGQRQVGVEAKLKNNIAMIAQVMNRTRIARGGKQYSPFPDFRSVLVPKSSADLRDVCYYLNIVVFTADTRLISLNPLFDLQTRIRLKLPSVPLQSGGGRPCPRTLSPWREKSLRLCIKLRRDGFVTGHDFKELGLHRQNWVRSWLIRSGTAGKYARYVRRPGIQLPDMGYELERDLIAEVDSNQEKNR